MNASFRPLCAAVCLLMVLLGVPASAQNQIIGANIIQAPQIDAAARQQINAFIAPAIADLVSGEPDKISNARKNLLNPIGNVGASVAFLDAYSEMISAKMDPAVNHKDLKTSVLVRMNAMIIISRLTDDGSMAHIAAGLEDDNVSVQRWAMKGLQERVKTWKNRAKNDNNLNIAPKLDGVIKQVVAKLEANQAPHPIVVGPGLLTLFEIGTEDAYVALNEQLNGRVDLHSKDLKLSYTPELVVIQVFSPALSIARPFNVKLGSDMNRAAFRYATLILGQLKAGKIGKDQLEDAKNMLNQCIVAMGQVSAGAGKNAPAGQGQANAAIVNSRWADIDKLLTDWAVILRAAPFNLTNQDLGL